ncbi:MAG: helix-turn-helix domain-containing protein [Thermoleophilia bacterium]
MGSAPPDPCIDFGRRLRRLRQERRLSQEQLAHLAKLDRAYVSSCEAGRRRSSQWPQYEKSGAGATYLCSVVRGLGCLAW